MAFLTVAKLPPSLPWWLVQVVQVPTVADPVRTPVAALGLITKSNIGTPCRNDLANAVCCAVGPHRSISSCTDLNRRLLAYSCLVLTRLEGRGTILGTRILHALRALLNLMDVLHLPVYSGQASALG